MRFGSCHCKNSKSAAGIAEGVAVCYGGGIVNVAAVRAATVGSGVQRRVMMTKVQTLKVSFAIGRHVKRDGFASRDEGQRAKPLGSRMVVINALRELRSQTGEELDALLPSILDKAFNGEL